MSTREERLELRLQKDSAYETRLSPLSRTSYSRTNSTSAVASNGIPLSSRTSPIGSSKAKFSPFLSITQNSSTKGSPFRFVPENKATSSSVRVPPSAEELLRIQERRERAREQERIERELERERLDREKEDNLIPDSKKAPQLLAAISVSTGCISYGICMAYSSSAIPSMLAENSTLNINVGVYETTWMSSLLALGALFGSLGAVYLMDAVGRKASLLAFSVMSLFIGWTLVMAASKAWQLYIGRFLLGFGAGLEITISPVYIHEICRPVLRDVCGSFPQVFMAMGIFLCYLMGRDLEWNWLALVSCVFLFPFTFGLYFIPESPPWLVYNDEEDLAFKSMVLIRGEEYDATVEIRKIKDNLVKHRNDLHALLNQDTNDANANSNSPQNKFRCKHLFQPSVLYPFLVILVLMFLLQFSGQGAITFYTELIFEEAECALEPKNSAIIIGATYFLSSILGLVLKKHMGRRILLLASELGMALSQLAMGIYFYILKGNKDMLKEQNLDLDQVKWLPIPIIVTFTVAFNIGMGSLTWVVATEILPVRSKRWTHTISNVTSNFWWFFVTKTFRDIYSDLGPSVPFLIYGSICLFGFVFIFIFLPETHGKTAEETANSFTSMSPVWRRIGCKAVCHLLCQCWPLNQLKKAQSTGNTNAHQTNNNGNSGE